MTKSGTAKNGKGDPYAHRPDVRSEEADTNGLMGALGDHGNAWQKGRPDLSWGQTRKDDHDPYGVV